MATPQRDEASSVFPGESPSDASVASFHGETPTSVISSFRLAPVWGIVGTRHTIESLIVLPGQKGVVRRLPTSVTYDRPPVEIGWSEVSGRKGRYEMVWPGEAEKSQSLALLGVAARTIRMNQGKLAPNHPVCRDFDEAIFALLTTVDKLQAKNWGIGLLTPGGVMLHRSITGTSAVPVDLGFVWGAEYRRTGFEHAPELPEWLLSDPERNPGVIAWEFPPLQQQFAQPSTEQSPPPYKAELRTVARVILWTVLGTPSRDVPETLGGPAADILRGILRDEYPTTRAALDAFRQSPPSTLFTAAPVQRTPTPVDSGSRRLIAITAGTLLVCLISAVLYAKQYYARRSENSPPSEAKTKATRRESRKAMEEFEAIPLQDLPQRIDKLRELTGAAKSSEDAQFLIRVKSARLGLFDDWVAVCEDKIKSFRESGSGDELAELRSLVERYRLFHEQFPPEEPLLGREKERLATFRDVR